MVVLLARRHQPAPRDIPLRRAGFPGTGLSSRTTRDRVRIAAYADVLDAIIDRLRLDDITLVLHDLGGAVGLTYAASHPDRIRGLIACQTFGWPLEQAALRFMLSAMGSAPVRALNVATNLVPRIGFGRSAWPYHQ